MITICLVGPIRRPGATMKLAYDSLLAERHVWFQSPLEFYWSLPTALIRLCSFKSQMQFVLQHVQDLICIDMLQLIRARR